MSRLVRSLDKMRAETGQAASAAQQAELQEFVAFYQTGFYKKNKARLQDRMDELNRKQIVDPSTLILVQGERNALQGELDYLNKMERRVNVMIKSR